MSKLKLAWFAWLILGAGTADRIEAQERTPGPVPSSGDTSPLPGATAADPPAATETSAPSSPIPLPFGGPLLERTKLTGDWGGVRDSLRDRGITWDIYSTNFYQGVASGGLQDAFRFGGRADYLLHVDGKKAGFWEGLFIDLHGETLYGQSVNSFTGALLPISLGQSVPIPAGQVTALTGVKITQALSENAVTYFGKINTLDDFNQPFTGGGRGVNGFSNAGLLLPPVLARTVPYSTFGAGFVLLSEMEPVFAVNVFDTHNTPTVSGFDTFFTNGATILAQATLPYKLLDRPGHLSVGGSYSSAKYTSLDDLPYFLAQQLRGELSPIPQKTGSWSVYGLFDQAVWVDPSDPKRSWGVFGSAGITDGDPNPIRWSTSVGIGGSNPFGCRKLDTFGVGYFYVGASDGLKGFAPRLFPLRDERGVELFYNVGITPWFNITPDLQVVTPVRDRVDTSVNFSIRAKLDF